MTLIAIKEKLHEYIDHADEKKVQAIYTLVENDFEDANHVYDQETLAMLEKRRDDYLRSNSKGLSEEQSMEHVKKELAKRGF